MSDSFADPQTVARQAPLSVGFCRQECWSGLSFPPPASLPNPGIEPVAPTSPVSQVYSLPTEPVGNPCLLTAHSVNRALSQVCLVPHLANFGAWLFVGDFSIQNSPSTPLKLCLVFLSLARQ